MLAITDFINNNLGQKRLKIIKDGRKNGRRMSIVCKLFVYFMLLFRRV